MQTLVEMLFEKYGKHISDEQMSYIEGLEFPHSDSLKRHASDLQDAFVYVVITLGDLSEQYLCYMLDHLASYKYNTFSDMNAFTVAENIQDHISDVLGETNAFLTSFLMEANETFWTNKQLRILEAFDGNYLDEVDNELYFNTLQGLS